MAAELLCFCSLSQQDVNVRSFFGSPSCCRAGTTGSPADFSDVMSAFNANEASVVPKCNYCA